MSSSAKPGLGARWAPPTRRAHDRPLQWCSGDSGKPLGGRPPAGAAFQPPIHALAVFNAAAKHAAPATRSTVAA